MMEVEDQYKHFGRHERIRIEQWSKKLCQVTTNPAWKRNRNLYAMLLVDCILNKKLTKPFTLVPPESHLKILSKAEVNSQLSSKFKSFQKNMGGKLSSLATLDNEENQNPQLINISANVSRNGGFKQAQSLQERSRSRGRVSGLAQHYMLNSRESQDTGFVRKHNYDPSMDKINSHPLYKNNVEVSDLKLRFI